MISFFMIYDVSIVIIFIMDSNFILDLSKLYPSIFLYYYVISISFIFTFLVITKTDIVACKKVVEDFICNSSLIRTFIFESNFLRKYNDLLNKLSDIVSHYS